MSEYLPPPEPQRFPDLAADSRWVREVPTGTLLGRIFRASGPHPSAWHEFRTYGPLDSHYDPHPLPAQEWADYGVMYTALEQQGPDCTLTASPFAASILESFQHGILDRSTGTPTFAAFELAQPVQLLDLSDSDWLTVAGGKAVCTSGPRRNAREWARAIAACYPQLDGVIAASSVLPSARIAALWLHSARALPAHPMSLLSLDRPELTHTLELIAERYGLTLL